MLGVAGLVLFGPKELPKVLGALGRFLGKARKMAMDLRVQSGIDEVLRSEGIAKDLEEFRRMARGGAFNLQRELTSHLTGLSGDTHAAPYDASLGPSAAPYAAHNHAPSAYGEDHMARADRSREYPPEGADASMSVSLTHGYDGEWPPSALAQDSFYLRGEIS